MLELGEEIFEIAIVTSLTEVIIYVRRLTCGVKGWVGQPAFGFDSMPTRFSDYVQ